MAINLWPLIYASFMAIMAIKLWPLIYPICFLVLVDFRAMQWSTCLGRNISADWNPRTEEKHLT